MKNISEIKVLNVRDKFCIVARSLITDDAVIMYDNLTQFEAYKIYEKIKAVDECLTEEDGVKNYNIGWIAVDLDGTLAEYHGWKGEDHIGAPILKMVERVKQWLADGENVKIFTARAFGDRPEAIKRVKEWCKEHIGQELEVTNVKDYGLRELYDDRCVQVIINTGEALQDKINYDRERHSYD